MKRFGQDIMLVPKELKLHIGQMYIKAAGN